MLADEAAVDQPARARLLLEVEGAAAEEEVELAAHVRVEKARRGLLLGRVVRGRVVERDLRVVEARLDGAAPLAVERVASSGSRNAARYSEAT